MAFSDMHVICDPVMLVGSGLCINTYSEEEARTRQLLAVVHKRTSILTFEGLSTTFEASTNVYFTYFCHKIKCYNGNICVKVASKMFSSNN